MILRTGKTTIARCLDRCDDLSRFFTVITAFALPLSTAAVNVFLVASILSCLCAGNWNRHYEILHSNRLAFLFLSFFFLFVLGLSYTAASPSEACHTLIKYSKFLLGFFLFSIFMHEKTARYALLAFLAAVTLTLLCSYYKFFSGGDFFSRFPNDSGLFKDHICTGFIVAFGSYCYSLLAFLEKKWRFFTIPLFLLSVYNVLFINVSRSGYLIFIGLMLLLNWQRFRWRGLVGAFGFVVLLLLSALLFSVHFKDRLFSIYDDLRHYTQGEIHTSIGLRVSFYRNSLKLLHQHPWIGTGTGSFTRAYEQIVSIQHSVSRTENPHNEYLYLAVQFGILGLAMLLILFGTHWQQSSRLEGMIKDFSQAVLVSISLGSLFNSWLYDVTQGIFYVFFTALSFSALSLTVASPQINPKPSIETSEIIPSSCRT